MAFMFICDSLKQIFKRNKKDYTDNYKERAAKNKEKIINKDVKTMKLECSKEFRKCINNGVTVAYVDFFLHTTYEFQDEISDIVLKELKEQHKDIEFSFSWRHFNNGYKGIRMSAM